MLSQNFRKTLLNSTFLSHFIIEQLLIYAFSFSLIPFEFFLEVLFQRFNLYYEYACKYFHWILWIISVRSIVKFYSDLHFKP